MYQRNIPKVIAKKKEGLSKCKGKKKWCTKENRRSGKNIEQKNKN